MVEPLPILGRKPSPYSREGHEDLPVLGRKPAPYRTTVDPDLVPLPTRAEQEREKERIMGIDKDVFLPDYDFLKEAGFTEDQEIDEDMVRDNKLWIDSAKIIYKNETGRDFKGSNDDAADWLFDRQAKFNWDITNLGMTTLDSDEWDEGTRQAWLDSMNMYDAMDSSAATWGRSAYHAITDPTFLPSLIFGFGIGGIAKTFGGRGAALVAKYSFKETLKNSLLKEGLRKGLSQKAATAVAQKGTKGGGQAALGVLGKKSVLAARKEAAKSLAKRQGLLVGGIGSAFGVADDILRQAVQQNIDPEYEYSPLQTAISGGMGAVLGGGIGFGLPRVGELIGRGRLYKASDQARRGEYGTEKVFNETLENIDDNAVAIDSKISEATDQLSPDGMLTLAAGKVYKKIKRPEYEKHLKDEGFRNKSDHVQDILNLRFKNVRKRIDKTGEIIFEASEKIMPDETTVSRIARDIGAMPQKTWLTNVVARVNKNISSTAGLNKELAHASVDMANNLEKTKGLIAIAGKKLNRALRKDFKMKLSKVANLESEVPTGEVALETVTKAFRGDADAIATLERKNFGRTLSAGRDLRRSMNEHQKDLLASGQVPSKMRKIANEAEAKELRKVLDNKKLKVGDEVETNQLRIKIEKSIGDEGDPLKKVKPEDDIDLYVTRSYELYDNPQWSKFIRETAEGQQLHAQSVDHVAAKLAKDGGLNKQEAHKRAVEYIEDLLAKGIDGEDRGAFLAETFTNTRNNKALSIFKTKKDIDPEIRALMGEITDPRSVVADTLWKINSDLETFKFQRAIRDAAESGRVEGLTVGRRAGEHMLPLLDQSTVTQRPGVTKTRLEGLPMRGDIAQPLRDVFATPALKNALEMGNELGPVTNSIYKKFIFLQGMTRSAKTVYSESAWARNFITAGMMSLANGNLNPVGIAQFRHVLRGLVNEAGGVEGAIARMRALGLHQSGIEVGAFKAAIEEASDGRFWREGSSNLLNPNKPTKKLVKLATKFQTTAANIYQAADDMWKHHAFYNEKKKYRSVLEGKGINPDEKVRETITSTGERIPITRLDEYAADIVKDTMQNYAQVSRAVKWLRRVPFADFVAYKSEMFRTAKGTLKTAFRDLGEGMEDMRRSGGSNGKKQFLLGMSRLGSATAVASSIPALAWTSAELTGMNEYETLPDGSLAVYTKAEGIKIATDREWDRGARWLWLAGDKNGEGKRINLSWLNPWQPFFGPLTAAYRELAEGRYPDPSSLEVANQLFVRPLKETFGSSMLLDGLIGILNNTDIYGRPLAGKDDDIGEQARSMLGRMWKAFEPGIYRDADRIVQSYNTRGKSALPDSPGFTRGGRKLIPQDQWVAMAGIKPEVYNVKDSLGYKMGNLQKRFKDVNDLKSLFKDFRPTDPQEFIDAYRNELDKQFNIMREMNKMYEAGLSSGLSQKDIIMAITGSGFFKSRFSNQVKGLMNRDEPIFIVGEPPIRFGAKMAEIIKQKTGVEMDRNEVYRQIANIYSDYVGRSLF